MDRHDRTSKTNWLMPALAILAIVVGLFRPEIRSLLVANISPILGWALDILILCALVAMIWWVVSSRKLIEEGIAEIEKHERDIDEKLDNRKQAIAEQEKFAKTLEDRVNTHNSRMTQIDTRLNAFDTRLNVFDSRQNSIESRLNTRVGESKTQDIT